MGDANRPLTPAEKRMRDRLRGIVRGLPEVTIERDGFGHSTFKVRKRSFVILGDRDGIPDLAIKSDPLTQERLVGLGPWYRTPYIGQHGWISIDGESLDWDQIGELVLDAWRLAAPRRLSREADRPR